MAEMTTFDLAEVQVFAAGLTAGMDRCDHGEGRECATIDASLYRYAELCCDFIETVRAWGREVFSGRVAFDPAVERVFKDEGHALYSRALDISKYGQKAEEACHVLEGRTVLRAALGELHRRLNAWVTPRRAVGPLARREHALDPAASEEAIRRIASLPSLPESWQPSDPRLRALYRKLKAR
jgi:hypothetical protein